MYTKNYENKNIVKCFKNIAYKMIRKVFMNL